GETVDRLERETERAVFVRAAPGEHLEKFDISASPMEELEKKHAPYKRAQVVECQVERSLVASEPGVVGWADGYMLVLEDGRSISQKNAGQKVRGKLTGVQREFAAGPSAHSRG